MPRTSANDPETHDVAVVGGGIVGLATARALVADGRSVVVLEAEPGVGRHQTGRNSGVVHSGLYYPPGSAKARLCTAGREAMFRFCEDEGLPWGRCGKLVLATEETELPRLDELERRGRANGLEGLRRLDPDEIREREPATRGIAGLEVPETGICDFGRVADRLARRLEESGAPILVDHRLLGVRREASHLVLETAGGVVRARRAVTCAGLQADRVARLFGVRPTVRIVPFRGEYKELVPERRHLVRHLIYPVPDPRFPFLGVHLTRTVDGRVEAGPNAVPALAREGYRWRDVSARDLASLATWPGAWRLAGRFASTGVEEIARSASTARFVRSLQRLIPELDRTDVVDGGSGVRAQAVSRDGRLLDDFEIVEHERSIHVLNAPSPAATASLAIGAEIARRLSRP